MNELFVDTGFWIAKVNPRDDLHERAESLAIKYSYRRLVTTDVVLVEIQNFFSRHGEQLRSLADKLVDIIEDDPNVLVLPQTRDTLAAARELYRKRTDKSYSLTDCYSMVVMRERKITEVLSYDEHFVQEGFVALMRNNEG
jgi:uncharacterized protein